MEEENDTFSGIIPMLNKISDREINEAIKEYRELKPEDKRTDYELRPYIVNTILKNRGKYYLRYLDEGKNYCC